MEAWRRERIERGRERAKRANENSEQLLALPGCVGVRERADALHAIFHLDPRRAEEQLARDLAGCGAHGREIREWRCAHRE